jgi:hypothetical protein
MTSYKSNRDKRFHEGFPALIQRCKDNIACSIVSVVGNSEDVDDILPEDHIIQGRKDSSKNVLESKGAATLASYVPVKAESQEPTEETSDSEFLDTASDGATVSIDEDFEDKGKKQKKGRVAAKTPAKTETKTRSSARAMTPTTSKKSSATSTTKLSKTKAKTPSATTSKATSAATASTKAAPVHQKKTPAKSDAVEVPGTVQVNQTPTKVVPESKQETPLLVGAAEAVSSPSHHKEGMKPEEMKSLLASMMAESEEAAQWLPPIFGSGQSIATRSIGSETARDLDVDLNLSEVDEQEMKPAAKSDKERAFEVAASFKDAERLAAIQASQQAFQAFLPPEPLKPVPVGHRRLRRYDRKDEDTSHAINKKPAATQAITKSPKMRSTPPLSAEQAEAKRVAKEAEHTQHQLNKDRLHVYVETMKSCLDIVDVSDPVPNVDTSKAMMTEDELAAHFEWKQRWDYDINQRRGMKRARKFVTIKMGHPRNKNNREEWKAAWLAKQLNKNQVTEEELEEHKEDVSQAWTKAKEELELKAMIHTYTGIVGVRYNEPLSHAPQEGRYIIQLNNGKECVVTREFMNQIFEPEAIQAILAFYQEKELPVEEGSTVMLDNRQIIGLRWEEPDPQLFCVKSEYEKDKTKVPDFKPLGDLCTYPRYVAMFGENDFEEITRQYAEANFPVEYLLKVVALGKRRVQKFFKVPVGAPRTGIDSHMYDPNMPVVKYKQHGRMTCLFSSFASALYYMGMTEEAAYVHERSSVFSAETIFSLELWGRFRKTVNEACGWLQLNRLKKHFDLLNYSGKYPAVVQLRATDGGTQHVITVVDGMIFDSNCDRALQLDREKLDWCCSSDDVESSFDRVEYGYIFREQQRFLGPRIAGYTKNFE